MGGGGGKGGGGQQIVGYEYYADIHLGLCHGTVDGIPRLFVGDRLAHQQCFFGSFTSGTRTLFDIDGIGQHYEYISTTVDGNVYSGQAAVGDPFFKIRTTGLNPDGSAFPYFTWVWRASEDFPTAPAWTDYTMPFQTAGRIQPDAEYGASISAYFNRASLDVRLNVGPAILLLKVEPATNPLNINDSHKITISIEDGGVVTSKWFYGGYVVGSSNSGVTGVHLSLMKNTEGTLLSQSQFPRALQVSLLGVTINNSTRVRVLIPAAKVPAYRNMAYDWFRHGGINSLKPPSVYPILKTVPNPNFNPADPVGTGPVNFTVTAGYQYLYNTGGGGAGYVEMGVYRLAEFGARYVPPLGKDPYPVEVSKWKLFGDEGGVGGTMWLMTGHPDQTPCAALRASKTKSGNFNESLSRGIASVYFHQFYWGNNPYLKPLVVTVERCMQTTAGELQWCADWVTWPDSHVCYKDMNPIHIIREAYTDKVWGCGVDDSYIGYSFEMCSYKIWEEGSGLSLVWTNETPINDFVQEVQRHVDAAVYEDPYTGKLEIKLIRGDYDVNTLVELNPSNSKVIKVTVPDAINIINQVTVEYRERSNPCTSDVMDRDAIIVMQDNAGIALAGRVINQTNSYPGISNATTAYAVAARDLAQLSHPFRAYTIEVDRTIGVILPGDVFKLVDPDNGIEGIVCRVGRRTESTLRDGGIVLEAAEDVFGTAFTDYSGVPVNTWTPPSSVIANHPVAAALELPYPILVKKYGSDIKINQIMDPGTHHAAYLGANPGGPARALKLAIVDPVDTDELGLDRAFVAALQLSAAVTLPTTAVFNVDPASSIDLEDLSGGFYALVGHNDKGSEVAGPDTREIVYVSEIVGSTLQVLRGVADTLPVDSIPAGSWLFVLDDTAPTSTKTYIDGDLATLTGVPCSASTVFEPTLLDPYYQIDVNIEGRRDRPFGPANLKVNDSYLHTQMQQAGDTAVTLTWAHRDRLTSQERAVSYFDIDNVGPEPGVTYTIEFQGNDEASPHVVSGLTGTSYNLTAADERVMRGILSGAPSLRLQSTGSALTLVQTVAPVLTITVYAVRGGVESYRKSVFTITRVGYGYNYGLRYGGAV